MDKNKIYDTVIIGGGPAGYTAALYGVRAGLNVVVLEKFSPGGQMTQTQKIDNYPGFDNGVDGFTLGFNMHQGAERFGAKTVKTEVLSADLSTQPKVIATDSGMFYGRTVIVATGADHRHLGLENEAALIGKGVGYCAACDGMFFRGKTVAVVGGGNSAVSDALLLSKICKKVYLIHRRNSLRAEKIHSDALMKAENVDFKWNCSVKKFIFEEKLTGADIGFTDGRVDRLELDGIFISIGRTPNTQMLKGQLELDSGGYIIADESTCTNIDGVFAAGDVRTKTVRQIVTAAADGAVAAHYAHEYISKDTEVL